MLMVDPILVNDKLVILNRTLILYDILPPNLARLRHLWEKKVSWDKQHPLPRRGSRNTQCTQMYSRATKFDTIMLDIWRFLSTILSTPKSGVSRIMRWIGQPLWRYIHCLQNECSSSFCFYFRTGCICRTVLHDLSLLAIRKTMQINSRPAEIIIYFWKQSGYLHGWWVWVVRIKLHRRVSVKNLELRGLGLGLGLGFVRLLSCV